MEPEAVAAALPAESALAVIGLRNILTGDPSFKAGARKDAVTLPKTIKEHVMAFLKRPDFDRTAAMPAFNLEKVGRLLVRGGTPENADALLKAVKDPLLNQAVMNLATKAIEYLAARKPHRERQGLDGIENLPPPAQATARFGRLWAVVNDPMLALRDLRENCLTVEMAQAFRDLFPALYQTTADAIQDGFVTMKTARKSWQLAIAKERQLRVFLGLPLHNVQLLTQIQAAYAADAQAIQQKGGAAPRQKALDEQSSNAASPSQKADAA